MDAMEGKATPSSRIKKTFRALDAFPKVEDEYQTRSVSGAFEYVNYRAVVVKYEYFVDNTAQLPLSVNIDIDVAMSCKLLTVQYYDVANEMSDLRAQIRMQEGGFSVDDSQVVADRQQPKADDEEKQAAVRDIIKAAMRTKAPLVTIDSESGPTPGCLIRGSFTVKKIGGRLQIMSLGHDGGGHGHNHGGGEAPQPAAPHTPHQIFNFTHRINRLSFGLDYPGLINPLDNRIEFTKESNQMYQYFISIVPTVYKDINENVIMTNQYALTEHRRVVDHEKGSHGMPGIFMKFELESLLVRIIEEPTQFSHLLVRLCGIIGGFVATSSLVARGLLTFTNIFKQRS